MPIYDPVHDISQHQSGTYIKYGMLLDEHGRKNDTCHQYEGNQLHRLVFLQLLVARDRKMDADRVIYVDTREQIRRGIRLVQHLTKLREDVVMCEIVWPQIVSVWIDC